MSKPLWSAPDLSAWSRVAALVDWEVPPRAIWEPGPRQGRWFPGGKVALGAQLVDRHTAGKPDAVAIRWEGEPGDARTITYAELAAEVVRLAGALRHLGVRRGDLIALHLGSIPEVVTTMLACVRIGAPFTVIPTPLPAEGLLDRLAALAPKVLFTQDGAWRHGLVLPLKARADDAVAEVAGIEHTVVVRRTGMDIAWYEGDYWYHDLLAEGRPGRQRAHHRKAPARLVEAEDPLLVASLPKRGGQSVAARLGVASLMAAAAVHLGGLADGPVLWVAGDISWPGTQLHGVLGPFVSGHTIVLCEGTLDVPGPSRAWDVLARNDITTFVTVPSILRRMRSWAPDLPDRPDPVGLRRVVAVGEVFDADLREWTRCGLAGHAVATADGWGQVELGGVVLLDDAVDSQLLPVPGTRIVDEGGAEVADGAVGELAVTQPWAGMALPGAPSDPEDGHWRGGAGPYFSGDLARRTTDGTLAFSGRIDRVVSVSGMLVSLGEVQSLLAEHPFTSSVDVIERGGPDGSRHIAAAVVLDPAETHGRSLAGIARELSLSIREILGGLACPQLLLVLDRVGDDLRGDERRRALSLIQVAPGERVAEVTWTQVLAVARALG